MSGRMDRGEGDMGSSDLDDYSQFLSSHVHRCTQSHLEECALDNLLPSEVSFSLICYLIKPTPLLMVYALSLSLLPLSGPLHSSPFLSFSPPPFPSTFSATQGSGSTYIYGHCDANFKPGMTKDECLHFVTNGKRLIS